MSGIMFFVVTLVVMVFIWAMVCCMLSAREADKLLRDKTKMLKDLNKKTKRRQQ